MRNCKCCEGVGTRTQRAFTTLAGQQYPERTDPCFFCEGRGTFSEPDVRAILDAIKGRRGLCSKRPADNRAYFVWRLARWHGGADVTMPVTAWSTIHGDPYKDELNTLAETVARHVFGTDLAAAHRWGLLLGHLDKEMPGLPDSAYPLGRVADADKPEEEALELI
jgi:hypothetical protein